MKNNEILNLKCPYCKQSLRRCFTGRKWKITCDTDDCSFKDVYAKAPEKVINYITAKPRGIHGKN